MAKDKIRKIWESKKPADKAADTLGGYTGNAVDAIRKAKKAKQAELDKILKGM